MGFWDNLFEDATDPKTGSNMKCAVGLFLGTLLLPWFLFWVFTYDIERIEEKTNLDKCLNKEKEEN